MLVQPSGPDEPLSELFGIESSTLFGVQGGGLATFETRRRFLLVLLVLT